MTFRDRTNYPIQRHRCPPYRRWKGRRSHTVIPAAPTIHTNVRSSPTFKDAPTTFKEAPTQKAGNPPCFPIALELRHHFSLLSGAAPLSNFKALHKLHKLQKLHKLHKTSKALWLIVRA